MAAGAVFAVVATGERRLEGRQENAWAQVGIELGRADARRSEGVESVCGVRMREKADIHVESW